MKGGVYRMLTFLVIFYYICAVKEYATPQVAYSLYPTFGT